MLTLLAVLVSGSCLGAPPAQAPKMPVTVLRVMATADTVLCPATPTAPAGSDPSLRLGQGGGYADDGHLLIRFDELPAVPARDIVQIRLGLYREWRGNAHDDADEIVKLVLPAPQPFTESEETWQSAAARPEPNNTVRDFQVGFQWDGVATSRLVLSTNPPGQGEYKYVDVTDIARGWFDGTRPNRGLLPITDFDQSVPWIGTAFVTSREGPQGQRPVLEITCPSRPGDVSDGRWAIVEADSATEPERTAATELRNYLRRICREWFEVVPEGSFDGRRPAIYLGDTAFARRNGVRRESLAGEEYVIRRVGDGLILCGGRPRGTLYAVMEFLEDHCGVRWLTLAGEEYVPLRPDLRLPRVDRRRKPAFVDRDLLPPHHYPRSGWYDDTTRRTLDRALAFGRINGPAPSIYLGVDAPTDRYGGHLRANHHGHTIRWYLEPEKCFAEHPEFYALQKGKRSPTGLCKTNPQMRELYFKNITELIGKGATDPDNPYIFHISDDDGPPQVCECPDCKAADARYGGANVGQMLDFLNWLAERGRGVWPPGTALETFAYTGYETPPPTGHIYEDVIIRFAPIHKCHWDRLDSAVNRQDLANLRGWLKLTKDVRIWDYPHQYGSGAEPVSGLAITRRGDAGLRAWVQRAVADAAVARAGLHLSLAAPVAPDERHAFTANINAFWEPNRGVRPRLFVWWQRPRDRAPTLSVLTDSAAAIVSSEKPAQPVHAIWEPGVERAGGLEVAGTLGQQEGLREWSYLRFDLSAIPPDARVTDAELVLSRVWARGNQGPATVEFRAVRRGAIWDPVTVTWETQPDIEDRVLFSLRLPPPVPGYAGYDGLFPQANLGALVDNIRLYHRLGMPGVFMETDAPGLNSGIHCDADLTFWVLMQAMWDPTRTADDLIRDFCTQYYGPASDAIIRYVGRLEEAYSRDPHRQAFHVGNYALQSFVSLDLITDCQRLFDEAERACGGDEELLLRVRRARLSVDLLTLFNLQRLESEYRRRHQSLGGFLFDREAIEQRYTEARLASVARRYPRRSLEAEREEIAKLLAAARQAGNWRLWRMPPAGQAPRRRAGSRPDDTKSGRGHANVWRTPVRREVLLMDSVPMASSETGVSAREAGDQFRRTGWNAKTKQMFMHPPVFSFSALAGAASYRLTVTSPHGLQHVLEAVAPQFSLDPIWAELPSGEDFRVSALALDRSGQALGEVEFAFHKKLPFEGKTLPPRSAYLDAGLKCVDFMLDTLFGRRQELRDYEVKPGGKAGWPGLFYSAQIRLLALCAKQFPEKAEEALRGASIFTDWLIAHSSPSDWAWPHCPPTQDIHGSTPVIQPSRLGMLGDAYLDLLEVKEDKRLLDATLKMADTLKARQLPDGRWPFRVDAKTGQTVIDYTSDQIEIIMFLDRLIADYGRNDLRNTVDRAVQWTLEGPCKDYRWEGQYDDMGGFEPYQGLQWLDTGLVILYLLQHRNDSKDYLPMAQDLLRYIDDQFIEWGFSPVFITPSAREQYNCYEFIDYSVAHYIKICIGFHQATGDDTYLEKAKVMANTLTNLQHPDGWFACQNATHRGDAANPGVLGEVQFEASWGPNYLPNCSAYAAEMLIRLAVYLRQAGK